MSETTGLYSNRPPETRLPLPGRNRPPNIICGLSAATFAHKEVACQQICKWCLWYFYRDCDSLASLFHALAIKGEISSPSVRLDGCVAWPRWRSETHFSLRRPHRCRPGFDFGGDAELISLLEFYLGFSFSMSVEAQTSLYTVRILSLYLEYRCDSKNIDKMAF